MRKKVVLFIIGLLSIAAIYRGFKTLTKELANDILDINDDLEF